MTYKHLKINKRDSFRPVLQKSDKEWELELSQDQYHILRNKGTERPFTGAFDAHFEPGKYVCAGCGTPLFYSGAKFNSHCGWPSLDAPATDENITYLKDTSHGMIRIEIVCSNCGGHLGHVFDDGPTDTGLRYCVNSASLLFKKEED